jgi:hypothetical protein
MAEQVQSGLRRYKGPFFPQAISPINELLERKFIRPEQFPGLMQNVSGYVHLYVQSGSTPELRTDDGYAWFRGFGFRFDEGAALFLIPYRSLSGCSKPLQRSCALYSNGNIGDLRRNRMTQDILDALEARL